MDFFAHQERARRNTVWLIIYFLVTIVAIIALVYFGVAGIAHAATRNDEQPIDFFVFHPRLFVGVVGAVLTVILSGSFYKTLQLAGDGHRVAVELGGVKVQPNSRDLDERVLLNVVEEMAIASGTPVPPVYVLNEEGINAFAAGTSPQNAVIGVTRGCLKTLSRDELQGVIAHEFSHILNGDMRMNVRLIGLLYGILLIAMIGYILLRLMAEIPARASSSDDDGKGTMAILAALCVTGLTLLGIGYVGVFFASLIQSAVSRQREFLADASAVQFTRNPAGIADALKRIGGWKQKARLTSVYAKEASHMFFGQGVMYLWFATHPPLETRIRRIEPSFDGQFPTTRPTQHSEADIIDPTTLRLHRQNLTSSHVTALAGVQHFETEPTNAVSHVGKPVEEHIDHAQRLVGDMDPMLVREVHDPMGAVAVVYALLLAPASSEIRGTQMGIIVQYHGDPLREEVLRVLDQTDALEIEQRLPLACMALPALDQLSDSQAGTLRIAVRRLIEADNRWTIFEYALQRFITKRLILRSSSPKPITQPSREQFVEAFQSVLSTLAHLGGNTHAEAAYQAAWSSWSNGPRIVPIIEKDQCTLARLDRSLDQLRPAPPTWKRAMLNAFSECIAYDQRATINEIELLRIISDALGCPMPPVLPNI
ncbi:MAG: M48 family metallopeptidase [Planctomycetota bacterium]